MNDIQLFRALVSVKNNTPVTTSRKIADAFGKKHYHILNLIKSLKCSDNFSKSNFGLADYIDDQGKSRPEYEITKNGAIFLIMGFTGEKASEFKENYIAAFDWMYESIQAKREIDLELGNYSRKELASVNNGSFHGKGLQQRKTEKADLAIELKSINERLQILLPLID